MGYMGTCSPKGYVFPVILVINRIWHLSFSVDMGMFIRRSHFFIIMEKKIDKSPSQIMFIAI